jgi:ABC-type phosphate/phosphonate transport system substrate-binding protein
MNPLRLNRAAALLVLLGLLSASRDPPARAAKPRPKPVTLCLYSSLLVGINDRDARRATTPLLRLLERKVGYPVRLRLEKGKASARHLMAFGAKLSAGKECQIGVVWGLEYGWLVKEYPELRPLAVISIGDKNLRDMSLLLVRKPFGGSSLAGLRGKRLARYRGAPLMEQVYLDKMLKDEGLDPQTHFRQGPPYGTLKEAVFALEAGQADCLMLSVAAWNRLMSVRPRLKELLVPVKQSDFYPRPALIGSVKAVDALRRGLWRRIQDALVAAHRTREGRECVRFWRFESFSRPRNYAAEARASARKVPIDTLLTPK